MPLFSRGSVASPSDADAVVAGPRIAAPGVPGWARAWVILSVVSLTIAGLLSVGVALGRLPGLSAWIADPLFFRRCLVVHVNLALVVWFYAFIVGLARLSAGRSAGGDRWTVPALAGIGVLLMLAGAGVRGAEPILANYLPVVDTPLFLAGLAAFALALVISAICILSTRLTAGEHALPVASQIGFRAAMVALLLAAVNWLLAQGMIPEDVSRLGYFELSAWGAGHTMQVANVCAMMGIWLWVVREISGREVMGRRLALLVFGGLLLPQLVTPFLAVFDSLRGYYIYGHTQLMRWGIFPWVLLVLALLLRRRYLVSPCGSIADGDAWHRVLRAGLAASIGLTLLGFILGSMIRGSTTLVPAHYHASLGGVTAALMTAAYLLAAKVRRPGMGFGGLVRLGRWQLLAFGVGQAIFALGFGIGGFLGQGRKEYGSEVVVRSAGEIAGLAVMGLGGLLATAGGVLFLFVLLREFGRHWLRPNLSVDQLNTLHQQQ